MVLLTILLALNREPSMRFVWSCTSE